MTFTIRATKRYPDAELGRDVEKDTELDVSAERAMKLVNHRVAEIIGYKSDDTGSHKEIQKLEAEIKRLNGLLDEADAEIIRVKGEQEQPKRGRPPKE